MSNVTSKRRLCSFATLLAAPSLAFGLASLQVPQCADSYNVSSVAECNCQPGGQLCSYTFAATPTPGTGYCETCRWDYIYSTSCPPCAGTAIGSGSIDLGCKFHKRSTSDVFILCPTTGANWVKIAFTCAACQ